MAHRLVSRLGQLAYLARYHGKTAPSLAHARRLNGSVQRQQIGLESNVANQLYQPGQRPPLLGKLQRTLLLGFRIGHTLHDVLVKLRNQLLVVSNALLGTTNDVARHLGAAIHNGIELRDYAVNVAQTGNDVERGFFCFLYDRTQLLAHHLVELRNLLQLIAHTLRRSGARFHTQTPVAIKRHGHQALGRE